MRFSTFRNRAFNSGFTAVEMVVYIIVFLLFMTGVIGAFTWFRYSKSGIQRLDVLHQLRLSTYVISEELSYGTNIIFPPVDETRKEKPFHQLVFTNSANEVQVVFIDENHRLQLLNLTKKSSGESSVMRLLTTNMIDFEVRRPNRYYVEYELTATDGDPISPKKFYLGNSTRFKNVLR